jgi:hypothetical protein
MPTITNADGSILDASWPSQNKPVMMDAINDADRKARQDAYDAEKAARGGLKSYSWVGEPMLSNTKRVRRDNTTGEIETVNL